MSAPTRPPADARKKQKTAKPIGSPLSEFGTPDRLPRATAQLSRGKEIQLGALGTLGLLLLVVGVPAVLVIFVGYPLPRSAPSSDWLTVSITATFIINVLACIVWLVWAHFVVCLLTEWRAIRKGRVPGHVALGGGSQLLARRLVATALLLAGAATTFSQTGLAHTGGSPAPAHRAVATAPASSAAAQQAEAASSAEHAADTTHSVKYYTVQPPHGRRYDSLWDIADRTLKDPLRYKEIFALNKDRLQSDGRKLVDANLIMPGWQLHLPADASGPGVHVSPVRPPVAPPSAPTQDPTPAHRPAHAPAHHAVTPASQDDQLLTELFGGALILAGLATALTARRGTYGAPAQEELAAGADPRLADRLDVALRSLAYARSAQGHTLPFVVSAWASEDRIQLFLVGGDTAEPPAPWQAWGGGLSWGVECADLPDKAPADAPAPYPGLLSVGQREGFELFVDLEQAPGVISVAGDAGRGRELAYALAVQAVTCRWTDGARVTTVGFGGDDLTPLAPQSIVSVPQLSDVLSELEAEHDQIQRLQRTLGIDGVLTGRQDHRSPAWQPQLVLLSGPPNAEEAARLQRLAADRSNVAVLVLGDVADAPWRFVMGEDGELDLGALGISATAHRFSHDSATALVQAARAADAERARSAASVRDADTVAAAMAGVEPVAAPRDPSVPAVATVRLLGQVAVEAGGDVDPASVPLLTEIVVALALHPAGLRDEVLRASVWPRGVSDDVVTSAMDAAARWLGVDATGSPCLARGEDGLWRLGDGVRVDLADLQALAARPGVDGDAAALEQALALFDGEAFSGTPAGRYGWLAFARGTREARLLGTAISRNAAALALDRGRQADAEQALRTGLRLVPTSEPMWRDLLRLGRWDGPGGASAVAGELITTLRAHRIWPEPETDALIAQVAPDYDGDPAAAARAG